MHFISVIMFAVSANIDNLIIAMAYGNKKININIYSNLLIAAISSLGTLISMSIGLVINKFIPLYIANLLGCFLLIFLGLWFILDFILKERKSKASLASAIDTKSSCYKYLLASPEKADTDNSGDIDIKEAISLAVALSLNNLGMGIGATITGINMLATLCFTFFFSVIFIPLGYTIGKNYLSKYLGRYAPILSAVIVIALGVYELFI